MNPAGGLAILVVLLAGCTTAAVDGPGVALSGGPGLPQAAAPALAFAAHADGEADGIAPSPLANAPPPRAVADAPMPAPGTSVLALDVDGRQRTAVVHVPGGLDGPGIPLLVLLHPAYASGQLMEWVTGMDAAAAEHGFIVAYPDGTEEPLYPGLRTWNAGHCCGTARDTQSDDDAFLTALVERLLQDYPIDPAHVGIAGHSNGGMLAHRFAARHGDLVSSVLVVAGSVGGHTTVEDPEQHVPVPSAPVSAFILHAIDDPIVPYGGGHPLIAFDPDRIDLPVQDSVDLWLAADGLTEASPTVTSGLVIRKEWTGGLAGTEVEFVTRTGGHGWSDPASAVPPYLPAEADLGVTDLVAGFFAAHHR